MYLSTFVICTKSWYNIVNLSIFNLYFEFVFLEFQYVTQCELSICKYGISRFLIPVVKSKYRYLQRNHLC